MAKNDFTAQAGISLEQWEKDIANMSAGMDKVNQRADKLAGGLSKVGSGLKVGTAAVFGAAIVGELAGVNVAVGDTSRAFKNLNASAFGDKAPEGFDKFANAALGAANATDGVIRKIPIVGEAISDLSNVTRKYAEDEQTVVVLTGKEAESVDALAQKLKELRDARTSEHDKTIRNEDSLRRLGGSIDETSRKYTQAVQRELDAGEENSAGQMQRIALTQLETERKQKLASLSESLKNQLGEKGDAGGKMYEAGAKKIEREIALKKRSLEFSETQEKVATNLNDKSAATTIEYDRQLELQYYKIVANETETAQAEKLFGKQSLIASQLRAQGNQLHIQKREMEYQHATAITMATDAVSAIQAQMAGNKALAGIEQNRVAHAQAIRDALRQGHPEIAKQIAMQQALGDLDVRAKQLRRTPKQVRDERKEQEKQDRAIRQINAAEKLNPNAVAADGRNHVSKAAALARAEFAARHAAPILKAADKQLNEIKANTIVVQQIKSQ